MRSLFQKLILSKGFYDVMEYVKEQKLEEALGDLSGFSVGTIRSSKYAHLEVGFWRPKLSGRNFK
jgi:hypothetical protein